MHTQWKPVPRFEGIYEVSNRGQVRRLHTARGYKALRVLVGSKDSSGYPQVLLRKDNKTHSKKVHRLVAEAFLGPIPEGMQVNHKDRNRANANVENLEYVTPQGNTIHGYLFQDRRDAVPKGEGHPNRVLNDEAVRDIRSRRMTIVAASKVYSVSATTIKHIRMGRAWKHVS